MALILSNISKSYGALQILKDISLTIPNDGRIGLVGANGVGKSTLLKIIIGELEADSGTVWLDLHTKLGYLAQVLHTVEGKTIRDLLAESQAALHEIESQLRALEIQMADKNTPNLAEVLAQYGDLTEQFERKGGYDSELRTQLISNGLRIDHLPQERLITTLSGGERTRVGLAMLLLSNPDLLLLDEPTNHLDFQSLAWLEDYLTSYKGAVLIVSHDRQFLNRTVKAIIDIDEHSREAKRYTGNYDSYRATKQIERTNWVAEYENQQEELKELRKALKGKARQVTNYRPPSDNDKMGYDFHTGRIEGVMSRNIRNIEERLRRIEDDPVPRPPELMQISPDFSPDTLNNPIPITLSNVSKSYDGKQILRDVSFSLSAADRVVIVAPNGTGKSTLLKLVAGVEKPDSGEVIRAGSAQIGYLDQEGDHFSPSHTLFEAYMTKRSVGGVMPPDWRDGSRSAEEVAKAELFRFGLFRYDDLLKPISALSSGQKRKLQLACLIAARSNVLLLDEPTNHLSFDVVEAFEDALRNFNGAILAVSHDRRFIERFQTEMRGFVWVVRDGQLIQH